MRNPMSSTAAQSEIATVAETVDRLTRAGYVDWFRSEDGRLRASKSGCLHVPEAMRVDEVARFEGETDPADEAIVFALTCKEHGVKGTFTTPYGKDTPTADAETIRLLHLEAA